MKISYPVRDAEGSEFCSADEIMRLINDEAHGTWLLGANGPWHGDRATGRWEGFYTELEPAEIPYSE